MTTVLMRQVHLWFVSVAMVALWCALLTSDLTFAFQKPQIKLYVMTAQSATS